MKGRGSDLKPEQMAKLRKALRNLKPSANSFVIANPNQCIACKACEVACFTAHNKHNHVGATVGTVTTPIMPRLFVIKTENCALPIQCRHCEDAPCANACPVQAIMQEDHAIVISEKACIGCKTCILACPFGAVDLFPEYDNGVEVMQVNLKEEKENKLEQKPKIIAYKCDLCKESSTPACVNACPLKALALVTPKEERKSRNRAAALHLLQTTKKL